MTILLSWPKTGDFLCSDAHILHVCCASVLENHLFSAQASELSTAPRNTLVKSLGAVNTQTKNTEQKEKGYQKLRSEYPLRTVELRTGTIKTTHFKQATKLAVVMSALGYLDTMNCLINHDLQQTEVFDADQFYINLAELFIKQYAVVLQQLGRVPEQSKIMQKIKAVRGDQVKQEQSQIQGDQIKQKQSQISREICYIIKDSVEKFPELPAASALAQVLVVIRCDQLDVVNITHDPQQVGSDTVVSNNNNRY